MGISPWYNVFSMGPFCLMDFFRFLLDFLNLRRILTSGWRLMRPQMVHFMLENSISRKAQQARNLIWQGFEDYFSFFKFNP